MKKILIIICLLLISCISLNKVNALVLEGEGDQFYLSETSYAKDEKFVYSATLNFDNSINSQAGGLVFGAEADDHYFVFNVDRIENRVKLLYFEVVETGYKVEELYIDYYIGNDKMNDNEKAMVLPKVATMGFVDLKVIITPEDDKVYAEFYADGIKRFIYGTDREVIDLSDKYEGGYLGYNTFQAKIDFTNVEIGKSDYSYYSEMYRQQYHYSQYNKWNNDPNGLVYYNGYYHLFFQHHPYDKLWGDMYWGHARSKDLVHWEQLPICVFPDRIDGVDGWAWSGSARVYHRGESSEVDNWLKPETETALIAFYTRDSSYQNQVIMISEDEGLTWEKKFMIKQQDLYTERIGSWRDPKVFKVNTGEKDIWGMVVANMEGNTAYFLKSENLINWSPAGEFQIYRPECIDVVYLEADDGTTQTVMLFEGREYLVGEMKYDAAKGEIYFEKHDGTDIRDFIDYELKGKDLEKKKEENEIGALKMDFAWDSYATQTFYIDDPNCENYGKTIAISWFSGVPSAPESVDSGAFQAVRERWNGGGFTIPVELGLVKQGDEYVLTQKPITVDNVDFTKESILEVESLDYGSDSANVLSSVNTHLFELSAEITNPNKEAIEFKVNIGEDEYTSIGWNSIDGYYVDRTHTSDAGLNLAYYRVKYSSYKGLDDTNLSFYILSDNGSIEVFCGDYTVPFYVLTLPSIYSTKATLEVSGDVTINNLMVNEIKSVYDRGDVPSDEGILYVNKDFVRLDLDLTKEDKILYYTTLEAVPTCEIVSGEGVVSFETSKEGIVVKALSTGEAELKITCAGKEKNVTVKVDSGRVESDILFSKDGIIGGNWYLSSEGLIGKQASGDGYILSNTSLKDCYYTAQFDLSNGVAAALILRANQDMSNYVMINYDKNGKIVKAWSPNKEYLNVWVGEFDYANVTLSAVVEGENVKVLINGKEVGNFTLESDILEEGYLGLNICAAEVVFKSITLQVSNYEYNGNKLNFKGNVDQYIQKIVNVTNKNTVIDKSFYTVSGREVYIDENYFKTLDHTGVYEFLVVGEYSTFTIVVDVKTIPSITFKNQELSTGDNLNVFIGSMEVENVYINGELYQDYEINNMVLTINSKAFKEGKNTLKINGSEIEVNVSPLNETIFENTTEQPFNILWVIIPLVVVVLITVGVVVFVLIRKRGK